MKVAIRRQVAVMKKLGEKFMSDEETDNEDNSVLIKRSLPWRSSALNKLILKLDNAYLKKKDNSKPSKKRVDGSWSNRAPPVKAPAWAVVREETQTADNRDSISEREQQVDSGNDADESALNTSTFTTGSNSEIVNDEFDDTSDDDDDELNDIFEAVTGTNA